MQAESCLLRKQTLSEHHGPETNPSGSEKQTICGFDRQANLCLINMRLPNQGRNSLHEDANVEEVEMSSRRAHHKRTFQHEKKTAISQT